MLPEHRNEFYHRERDKKMNFVDTVEKITVRAEED